MERNIDVIKDADGNSVVMINDIRFKGIRLVKRNLGCCEDVFYVGDVYQIVDTENYIYWE